MFHMLSLKSEEEMTRKIFLSQGCGCIIIQNDQVIIPVTCKSVPVKVMMNIPEPAVSFSVINGLKIMPGEKSRLGTPQHVAVHAIGPKHNP